MKNKYFLLIVAFALMGCQGYSLEQLRRAEPVGSEFNKLLALHYLDFSETKARRYDWVDSAHFADKGLLVAYNSEVGPEEISHYRVALDNLAELEKARKKLLSLLNDKNRKERPAVAADAMFSFDCWLEGEENAKESAGSKQAMADCREKFNSRIAELEDSSYEKLLGKQGELGAEIDTSSYIVFFEWGQSVVTKTGSKIIGEVIKTLKPTENYEIILNAHTDTSGDAMYNMRLSNRRAKAVKAKLVKAGIRKKAITIFAFGESDPPVKTKDGVREPKNRRVEIFLGE